MKSYEDRQYQNKLVNKIVGTKPKCRVKSSLFQHAQLVCVQELGKDISLTLKSCK